MATSLGFSATMYPLVCQSQGPDSVMVTSVGKSFHVYKVSQIISEFCMIMLLISMQCDKLKLIFVGMCTYAFLVSVAINRYFVLFLGTHQPELLECLAIQGKIV